MLSQAQIDFFQKNGFVKGSRILSNQEIELLQSETLRVIEQRDNLEIPQPVLCHQMGEGIWQIVNIWQASEPFKNLIHNSQLSKEIKQLIPAKQIRLWHDQIQYKPPSIGSPNHWHQDSPYWQVLKPKDEQITAWVALDDADEENGCMKMVPGSHLWGVHIDFLEAIPNFDEMPEQFEDKKIEVITCPVKKGEVHYHHSLTWHGSGKNLSGRPRRAIAMHFMSNQTRFDASGDHVMKPFIKVTDGEPISGDNFLSI